MKALYEVTTRHRKENPIGNGNWASYNVIASSAAEAIRKAERKYTLKTAEYATEVQILGKID